ncbi:MAG: alcohol dehydrogenase [Idiomarinaceae bacterium HL-53]|nr:MAG: alcohol dehydrogenase [Idiomarinaceae bacterium HL-53]CUS49565.1 Alcohol dehydrogenase, class IV [Idiomarinaceae bacterium HL-53]
MLFWLEVAFLRIYMRLFKAITALLPIHWPREFSGPGSAQELLAHIKNEGHAHIFLVTDSNLIKAGVVPPLLEKIGALGMQVTLFQEVSPDPPMAQIELGYQRLRDSQAKVVLAIGGGSVIDAAKLISARALNDKPVHKLTGLFKVRKGILPLFVIPTTAGTGSEVTIAAVVSDPVKQRKLPVLDPKLMPTAMALDAEIMKGLPPAITAATGMDALTHAIEAYISRNATQETDQRALAAAKKIFQYLPNAYADGNDTEARQQMAEASKLAGQAFTIAGVGYVHAIAHNLGALYHLPHGLANAIVMPHVLKASRPNCDAKLARMAIYCSLADESDSDAEAATKLIETIVRMNKELSIPVRVVELRPADIERITKAAREEARFTYAVPRYLKKNEMKSLLQGLHMRNH